MSFFGNDAINRVNLHSGVQALAQCAGGVFILVFLLKAGVPTPLVLAVMAGITLGRLALRPAVLPLARGGGSGLGGPAALGAHPAGASRPGGGRPGPGRELSGAPGLLTRAPLPTDARLPGRTGRD
ncbi:MAG: hypothetical protein JWQ97_2970 [Phenylobacterium sp.]|nr:hypothetical protein [Phenylobacterium sp.]